MKILTFCYISICLVLGGASALNSKCESPASSTTATNTSFSISNELKNGTEKLNQKINPKLTQFKTEIQDIPRELTELMELYQERINEGQIADDCEFPFQVGLQIRRNYTKPQYWCGGALISPDWVLTAAHCLDNTISLTVILGARNRKDEYEHGRVTRTVEIYQLTPHPFWDKITLANDIALIRLVPSIVLTDRIHPIKMPNLGIKTDLFEGSKAWTSGWGRFSSNKKPKKLSSLLRYTQGHILGNKDCMKFFPLLIKQSNICFSGQRRRGVCEGDSGGPLFVRDTNGYPKLVGVASFGTGCGSRRPGVFTRITYYLEWISFVTGINL